MNKGQALKQFNEEYGALKERLLKDQQILAYQPR